MKDEATNMKDHDLDICALLGYYAASNGNPSLRFGDNVLIPISRVKSRRRKDSLSRNVGKDLPSDAA
jgi:hypothetical protein